MSGVAAYTSSSEGRHRWENSASEQPDSDQDDVETYTAEGRYLFGSPDSGMNLRNKNP